MPLRTALNSDTKIKKGSNETSKRKEVFEGKEPQAQSNASARLKTMKKRVESRRKWGFLLGKDARSKNANGKHSVGALWGGGNFSSKRTDTGKIDGWRLT